MSMARLAMNTLQQRVSFSSLLNTQIGNRRMAVPQQQRWGSELLRRFSTSASEKVSDEKSSQGREVAVSEGDSSKKSKLYPSRRRKGQWRRGLWRNDSRDLIPFSLNEFFPLPSGLENALLEATENLNRLFGNVLPSGLIGRIMEDDEAYKLRYELPGLSKEDVKITIEDGFLVIKGEHKEEKDKEGSNDYAASFRYYNTSLLLPEDATVDEIKAELKDGVLTITVPRTEKPKKDVKEVKID